MKILLHTCCAPCLIKCADALEGEGTEFSLFWYNPNIHPYTEYKSRKNSLVEYAKSKKFEVHTKDEYGLKKFITSVYPNFDARCAQCYNMRLEETARYASENNYEAFSTTLLISPYQKHDLIASVGIQAANKYGVKFEYRDFRPYFREGQAKARELGLYMQKYCGCIFSEEERYLKKQ